MFKRKSLATKLFVTLGYNHTLNIFLLEVNFDKSTIGSLLLVVFSMLANFLKN